MSAVKPWRLFTRPARHIRRRAVRGEQYDRSRWKLHARYDTEDTAKAALAVLTAKDNPHFPLHQWKIMHQREGRP